MYVFNKTNMQGYANLLNIIKYMMVFCLFLNYTNAHMDTCIDVFLFSCVTGLKPAITTTW